jgi:hypothetical protein
VSQQKALLETVSPNERVIVETFLKLKQGGEMDFDAMSETLFAWSKNWIANTN